MPWPERDTTTRLLAGTVGLLLGAILGVVAIALNLFTLDAPTSVVLYAIVAGALIGFVAAFWLGDPAVRFLARVFRWVP